MNKEELTRVIESHKKWFNGEKGERANLKGADLHEADLSRADLDFSCLPLWCGSFGVKVDSNIYTQILYHLCRMDVDDEECKAHQRMSRELANKAPVRERHGLPKLKEVGE